MSAEANLAATRQLIFEAFNQGNCAVLHTCFHPDFIENQHGSLPGIAGVQSKIENLRRAFPDVLFVIEDMVAQEDKVWLRMTARGTFLGAFIGPPNGKSFEITVFDQLRFRDGRIVEHWGSPDRFALLEQLGMLPKALNPTAGLERTG